MNVKVKFYRREYRHPWMQWAIDIVVAVAVLLVGGGLLARDGDGDTVGGIVVLAAGVLYVAGVAWIRKLPKAGDRQ